MIETFWLLNIITAVLTGINTLCWGLCVKDVGKASLSLEFLLKLGFNKYFILSMITAFSAMLLRYHIRQGMGIVKSGFFLMFSTIVVVVVGYVFLGEKLTLTDWFGTGLILGGVFILGL